VLIDSADDLEQGAANALLKSLEEPPRDVIFLLIAHAPGRLLPTIRSRCRMLRFNALGDADMSQALATILPELSEPTRAALMRGADGAPGAALAMQALDVPEMVEALDRIAQGGSLGSAARSKLVAALSPIGARPRLEAFVDLVPRYIGGLARQAPGETRAAHLAAWDESRRIADKAITPYQLEPGALVYMLCATLSGLGRPAQHR
jgi:DNA polymerase III subunit delta'